MNRIPAQFGNHEGNAIVHYAEVTANDSATVAITGASMASPISITTGTAHGYSTGDVVVISGVGGNTAANGTWTIAVTSSTQFTLTGSTGSGTYTSGGTVGYAQPVKVQFLLWDGTAFVYDTYGSELRIGDRSTQVQVGDRLFVTWRTDSQRWEPLTGAGEEKKRAIRGTWYSGTTTLQIDNVYLLDSGTDPRSTPGDLTELVEVTNVPGDTYSSGQKVYADWNEDLTRWEARPKGGSGTEKYRLVRGQCVGGVAADATAFNIDNIVVLAGGNDPRVTPGSMAETLSIANSQKESFLDNEYVCAIYYDTGWQTILAERYRAIRGTYYSGTTTLQIKNVVPLESGLDPRSSPGDSNEIVEVANRPGDTYTSGEEVVADYDATSGDWEARPKVAAYIVRGTVDSATSTSASTFTISSLTAVSGPVPSAPLTVQQVFPVGYAAGQTALAIKAANGQWINTPDAGKVLSYTADVVPSYLIDAIVDQTAFDSDDHQVVYGQAVDTGGGDYKVKLFTAKGAGGGGTTYTAGCGLVLATTTFRVDYDNLAGDVLETGLEVKSNAPACSNLRAVVNVEPGVMYTEADVAKERLSAGGIRGLDPGGGTVKLYRKSSDPSIFLNFDGPVPISNWSQEQKLAKDGQVLVGTTREGERFGIPLGGIVKRIHFICQSSIPAATAIAGPSVLPATINVETTERNTSNRFVPTGEHVEVEYFDGIAYPAPPTGKAYTGEALQIGSETPFVIAIYCHDFSVSSAG